MTDGRTLWWAKDAMWHDREVIVLLASEFGAEGPNVIDVLCCQAKLENNGGRVKTGYASLTRKAAIKDDQATRAIIARAVELGALDDFSEDRLTFTTRVSGWEADQQLAGSAERMRRYRERQRNEPSPDVTVTSQSREVALTGQDRTGQEKDNSSVEASLDVSDRGAVARGLFRAWQERCGHPNAKPTRSRLRKIEQRLAEGYDEQQILQAIDGAARAAFVNDQGKRFDDIELICRNGEKLESFIDRASLPTGAASVHPINGRRENASDMLRDIHGIGGAA